MTELHVLIACAGGLVDPGMAMYNFLRGIAVPVSTHNYGSVDSIASVIYCAGSRRVASPHCKFLLHGITWNVNQPTAATEHHLREYLGQIEAMKRNIASVFAEAMGKPQAEVESDLTKSITLTAEEAIAYGLVHELKRELLPAGADVTSL